MKRILASERYNKFKCTGSECIDNCCHSWGIIIDDKTIDKYKGLENEHGEKIIDAIDMEHKMLKLEKNGKCSLLDEKGLCYIHSNLGSEYLSVTCAKYPRKILEAGKTTYASIELSCPVSVEDALFSKDENTFYVKDIDNKPEKNVNPLDDAEEELITNIAIMTITILERREVSIKNRYTYLAMLFDTLQKTANEGKGIKEYYGVLNSYKLAIDRNMLEGLFLGIPTENKEVKWTIGIPICDLIYKVAGYGETYNGSKENIEFKEQLIKNGEKLKEEGFETVKERYETVLQKYIDENEEVFENYLKEIILLDIFGTKKEKIFNNIISSYITLEGLKYFIILATLHKDEIEHSDIVNSIYLLDRITSHKKIYIDFKKEMLNKKRMLNIETMTQII